MSIQTRIVENVLKDEHPPVDEAIIHMADIYDKFSVPEGHVLVAVFTKEEQKLERLLTTPKEFWEAFETLDRNDPKVQYHYVLITPDIKGVDDIEIKYSWLPPVDHETEITTEAEVDVDKE